MLDLETVQSQAHKLVSIQIQQDHSNLCSYICMAMFCVEYDCNALFLDDSKNVVCTSLRGSGEVSLSSKILATLFGPIPYTGEKQGK